MPELLSRDRIKRLDNRLANQIAAGEVVERPASVVKELMENSIDAGASRIEVEIERGGTRLIQLTDNGCGIVKEDLTLALSRHATSKIATTADLSAIASLGFRGEALASIASVSRLCLTSRTADSDLAWQAVAEGRDMTVDIQPASATQGTRIEVRDLFFNTPARQKFLRAEKTEFNHVEEVFKRHALVNFDTAFILKHNNKIVKRIPASHNHSDLKRIESICGKAFADHAIEFNCQHEALSINGWVGGVQFHRSESDIQYVFVNGRPVKDKMLNHAIRQSYQGLLPPGRMPTYVIFLQIAHDKIDVNVHPTKHEVRFDEQRLVHDLLVKSVADALLLEVELDTDTNANAGTVNVDAVNENANVESRTNYPSQASYSYNRSQKSYGQSPRQVQDKPLAQAENYLAVTEKSKSFSVVRFDSEIILLTLNKQLFIFKELDLFNAYLEQFNQVDDLQVNSKPLLFPITIAIAHELLENSGTVKTLNAFGFIFEPSSDNAIVLRAIPDWWQDKNMSELTTIFPQWVEKISSSVAVLYDDNEYLLPAKKWRHLFETLSPLSDNSIDYFIEYFIGDFSLFAQPVTNEMIKKLLD